MTNKELKTDNNGHQIPFGSGLRKVERDEGEKFDVAGSRFTWKVKGEDTGYAFSIYEQELEPGEGVPLHCHAYGEVFYALSGYIDFLRVTGAGEEWITCAGGVSELKPHYDFIVCGSDPVRIDANYLADPQDLKDLIAGLSVAREIGNSAALRPFAGREIAPGSLKAAELERFFCDGLGTFWHQSCTAKMGRDAMSVVDWQIEGLRCGWPPYCRCFHYASCNDRQHDGALRSDRRAGGRTPVLRAQAETFTARSGSWDESNRGKI